MVPEYRSSFLLAKNRLASYLGTEIAEEVLEQALQLSGVTESPNSAEELYRIGVMLGEHPDNAISAIGVSMKVKALLLGAEKL